MLLGAFGLVIQMGAIISREQFASAVVVVTSMTAYMKVPGKRSYAKAAYRLYCVTGILNLTSLFLGYSTGWKRPLEITFTWAYALGLPLLAADICIANGVFSGLATLHIVVPTATLIVYHYDPHQLDPYLLGISHGYSMLAMVGCGIIENRLVPFALTVIYYFTLFQGQLRRSIKMSSDLDQVAIVKYLVLKDLSPGDIHNELRFYKGGVALPLDSISRLCNEFQGLKTEIKKTQATRRKVKIPTGIEHEHADIMETFGHHFMAGAFN